MASASSTVTKLVQYIVVRRDLLGKAGWSTGALIAQACHASTAALHLFREHPHTVEYLRDIDRMHKVVLEVESEGGLKEVCDRLEENVIEFKLWIEQPENIPTSLACRPYPQNLIKPNFTGLKLFK